MPKTTTIPLLPCCSGEFGWVGGNRRSRMGSCAEEQRDGEGSGRHGYIAIATKGAMVRRAGTVVRPNRTVAGAVRRCVRLRWQAAVSCEFMRLRRRGC